MKFTHKEVRDLWIAGIMISFAFAILLAGGITSLFKVSTNSLLVFIIAFFTAGIGFLLHELAHKIVAQRYGLQAEFKAFYGMLWLAILFSLFGFIIAAPGAVFISGMINRERNGKISIAGPLTNIAIALIFLVLLLSFNTGGILDLFFNFGFTINSLLALFNMIPAMPFDGAKVIKWNKTIYTITIIFAALLFISSFFL